MKLEAGKVAVVTGAASGIGFALAERFASAGMHVVLADVDEAGLAAAAGRIGARGVDTLTVRTDVSDEAVGAGARRGGDRALRRRSTSCATTRASCRSADAVVRAARRRGQWVFGVNFWGVIHGVRAFLPIARRAGRRSHREHREHRRPAPGLRRGLRRDASTRSWRSPTTSTTAMQQVRAPDRRERAVSGLGAHEHPRRRAQLARQSSATEPPARSAPTSCSATCAACIDEGMPPAVVADLVADAVQAERFWVLPHPEFVEIAVQRWHDIAEGVNPRIDVRGARASRRRPRSPRRSSRRSPAERGRDAQLELGGRSRRSLAHGAVRRDPPEVGAGEAVLRVDRVGATANNVTYTLLGDAMHYWDFFPTRPGWGLVPLWGFGEVVASATEGVELGSRVYGYFPSASHLVVRPGRVDARGFRDRASIAPQLPSPYNNYVLPRPTPRTTPTAKTC